MPRLAKVRWSHAAATAFVAAAGVAFVGCTWDWDRFDNGDGQPKPPLPGYELVFSDECDGSTVDPSKWSTSYISGTGVGFRRYSWSGSYVLDTNVTVSGGACRIRIDDEPAGDARFSSGTLDSGTTFEQQYGFFEVRLRAVSGKGVWTSASLQDQAVWPPQVNFAAVSGSRPSTAAFQVWYRTTTEGETQFEGKEAAASDLSQDFHTYGVEWTPDALSFYLDGVLTARATQAAAYVRGAMRVQITTHVGGEDREQPDATTKFPAEVAVDWVRVYRKR